MNSQQLKSPSLKVTKWLNYDDDITLENLQGNVIAIYAFQMLCPSCVENSIPQAKKVHAIFQQHNVTVLGLHTVFEHHEAMSEVALKAFIHEYQITFPIGIDLPSNNISDKPIPQTMDAYQMRGTPTLLLFDKQGLLRKHKLGHEDDLILGAELMNLIQQPIPK